MELRLVTETDKNFVMSVDRHVDEAGFANRVYTKSGFVIWDNNEPVGIMSHCILWDNLPFLNLIIIKEEYRGRGFGRQAMLSWECEMKKRGFKMVLLSTQADETAQHFYRKLGYVDCGGLVFGGTPADQPMEVFFRKVL